METKFEKLTDYTIQLSFESEGVSIKKQLSLPVDGWNGDLYPINQIKENLITTANEISRSIDESDSDFVLGIFEAFLNDEERKNFIQNFNDDYQNQNTNWIPFEKGVKLPEGLLLFKFDDGTIILSTETNLPFAVMTHFKEVL